MTEKKKIFEQDSTSQTPKDNIDSDYDPVPALRADADTLPKLFMHTARRLGASQVAMRKKHLGVWQEYTWADSLQRVRNVCLGLVELGLKRGDKVSIIGDNDPEYYWAELAAQSAGGTTLGIFTDATPRELEYLLTDSDTTIVIAHDQEQVDKILEIREQLPKLLKVVYWDAKGLQNYETDWIISWDDVEVLGQAVHERDPQRYETLVNEGSGDDIAILSYTSGTTSLPKGAMISHANLYFGSQHSTAELMPVYMGDDYVSFSPLAWITEQSLGMANHVIHAMVVNFPEAAGTVQQDIREIAPVTLLFPSRLWESLVRTVQANMVDADIINRTIYRLFLPVGYKMAEFEERRKQPPIHWRVLNGIGELLLFAPLRDKLGLTRLRYGYTSGSAISPEVLKFFRAININLHQLYGSTECQGHTIHYPGEVKVGTVGKPMPTVQVKIDDDGQILIKSRAVFQGYYKSPEKTEEAKKDDWFHTGDSGYFDEDGHLVYLDRMKDLIELGGGERFSPQYIEGSLKFSPYVHDVMALGSVEMPYVSALITIDFENVARWAENRGINFTTMVDLSQRDEVNELILKDIERVNEQLPPASRIRRFVIMPRSFDADESELTRTRKLRRGFMEQKYSEILGAIYGGHDSVVLTSEVRYRDGRVGQTESDIVVRTVGDAQDLPVVELAKE
ncbi:MAG: AMP-binding protein [Chloroflexi bacterium]|nr:AMP-binding protein [Chloroflexota bacterium]